MILFKIKKRKVWHIANSWQSSLCHNARTYNLDNTSYTKTHTNWKEYTSQPDEDYVDLMEASEIPNDIHGSICKACVMHAFDDGVIRIVSNDQYQ